MGWAACDFLVPCENTEKFVMENEWYEQPINNLSLKTKLRCSAPDVFCEYQAS